MASHLLIGGFVYVLSLGPLVFLIVKRFRTFSAFRYLVLWQIITVAALQPLMWAAAISPECWYWYNVLTWATRSTTAMTFLAAAGELTGFLTSGWILGSLCGLAMAIGQGHDWIAVLYCAIGFITAGACGLTIYRQEIDKRIPLGLLLLTLFPAISETSGALQDGGWSRMVPTLSIWLACAIWLWPTKTLVAFPRNTTSLNLGRPFKSAADRRFTRGKEAKRA